MTYFKYTGTNKRGELVKGVIDADDPQAAQQALYAQSIKVTTIKRDWTRIELGAGSVTSKDLVVFTRQFATMISAGLSIIQALDILGTNAENPAFRKVLRKAKRAVEEGKSLSEALKEHPTVFTDLYVNLVAAGEVGGILDTILDRLAMFLEKNDKLKKRVKGAMSYPLVVLVATVGIVAVLLVWVIPTFAAMFISQGQELPGLTKMIVDLSDWFQANIILMAIIGAGAFVGIKVLLKNKKIQYRMHKLALGAPVFGDLIKKTSVARFTRTLATLLSSGVPLVDGLQVVSSTSGNMVVEEGILFVRDRVMEGQDMTTPLVDVKIFPQMVVSMIGVGEATGAMDTMLSKIADFYEEEVDVAVGALTSMLEPIMMVFIGGIVGTTMVAMYLPIFKMAGTVGGE
ncbi:MAG TPA: type II secretion system F family protein [bacterium]|nr:type II secretion system F family protein [bacterium]